jgi:hypothetical protein
MEIKIYPIVHSKHFFILKMLDSTERFSFTYWRARELTATFPRKENPEFFQIRNPAGKMTSSGEKVTNLARFDDFELFLRI